MAILQPETYGCLASGYLPISYGGYRSVVACFPGQSGVTVALSGSQQYLVPFWASGGTIVSGTWQQCSTATPYAGYSLTALDDNRMLYTTQTLARTWATVFQLNPDGTFASGTSYQIPFTALAGYNGYHQPRSHVAVMRTFSGAITKFVFGGSDWNHSTTAPIPTIHVGNVSGLTILNATDHVQCFSDASRWASSADMELCRVSVRQTPSFISPTAVRPCLRI